MNIVQKVNNRDVMPSRHYNYQEVTVDAEGKGPIVSFDGVHARNSGLAGLSPLKQSHAINENLKNKGEKSWYDKFSDAGHLALDVAGMIPVFGAIADGVNAAWYLGEGDYGMAALSGAAMIPGAGQAATATKLAAKGIKAGKGVLPSVGKSIAKGARSAPVTTAVDAAVGGDMVFNDGQGTMKVLDSKIPGLDKSIMDYGVQGYLKAEDMYDNFKGGVSQPNEMPQHVKDFQEGIPPPTMSEEEQMKIMDKAIENKSKPKKSNLSESWITASKKKFDKKN